MKLRRKRTKKLTRKSNCISHADLPQFIGHRSMNVGDNPDDTPSLSEMYYFACSLHSLLLTNCIFMSHICVELLQLLFLFFSLSLFLPPSLHYASSFLFSIPSFFLMQTLFSSLSLFFFLPLLLFFLHLLFVSFLSFFIFHISLLRFSPFFSHYPLFLCFLM